MDIVLHWDQKKTEIFLNNSYKGTSDFYHNDIKNVKTLFLYNLRENSTSYWKDI